MRVWEEKFPEKKSGWEEEIETRQKGKKTRRNGRKSYHIADKEGYPNRFKGENVGKGESRKNNKAGGGRKKFPTKKLGSSNNMRTQKRSQFLQQPRGNMKKSIKGKGKNWGGSASRGKGKKGGKNTRGPFTQFPKEFPIHFVRWGAQGEGGKKPKKGPRIS